MEHQHINRDVFAIRNAARYLAEIVVVTLAVTAFSVTAAEPDRASVTYEPGSVATVCATPATVGSVPPDSSAPLAPPGPRP